MEQDGQEAEPSTRPAYRHVARLGRDYAHGDGLLRATLLRRYRRGAGDPMYRPLRIFMSDPVEAGYTGRSTLIQVPYEQLTPGPTGSFLAVVDADLIRDRAVGTLDLEDRMIIMEQGVNPSTADPLFHQQMVYAVCSDVAATFTVALGRDLSWGFDGSHLKLRPHYGEERNAYYDQRSGELRFGYFAADPTPGAGVLPGGTIYTCLSHDIIAHEMTHAILDGMRARFHEPTNPDVLAFHEGFADLVAILQHFSHGEIVEEAIVSNGGSLGEDGTIFSIAEQFGEATGVNGPLRSARPKSGAVYGKTQEPHDLGSMLVSAIMDALSRTFERRAAPIKALIASQGGAAAALHPAAVALLAELATKVAGQFLALCIRAVDYCPPVDIRFGEYLRALITADYDLVEDDKHHFRQELIAAFARQRIFPDDVPDISEDALLWDGPSIPLPAIPGLAFDRLQLRPDPGETPGAAEIDREAGALADVVTDPRYLAEFGLSPSADFDIPTIESVRILRRVGPDRQVRFGLVCEVLQTGRMRVGDQLTDVIGGATIIMDGAGVIRFVIRKSVDRTVRADANLCFADSPEGSAQQQAADEGRTWARMHAGHR